MSHRLRVTSLRPLVRYVDGEQAVIDARFSLAAEPVGWAGAVGAGRVHGPGAEVVASVHLEIDGGDGFHDEGDVRLLLEENGSSFRFEVVHPSRWWPSGMGEQPLYDLKLWVRLDDGRTAQRRVELGLTSVRSAEGVETLLVNGRPAPIRSVIPVDIVDEKALLPASGSTLLLVRDHYGPDLLYRAADRAGVLLVQCVPIDAGAAPEDALETQVDRLAPHPSLAGWYVGDLGAISDAVAARLRELDPTHAVFRELPVAA